MLFNFYEQNLNTRVVNCPGFYCTSPVFNLESIVSNALIFLENLKSVLYKLCNEIMEYGSLIAESSKSSVSLT